MKTKIGWVYDPDGPLDGVKVELITKNPGGTSRVKLLEPGIGPGWRIGDVVTISTYQFQWRKPN